MIFQHAGTFALTAARGLLVLAGAGLSFGLLVRLDALSERLHSVDKGTWQAEHAWRVLRDENDRRWARRFETELPNGERC